MGLFGPPKVEKMEARRDINGLVKALGYQKDVTICTTAAAALARIGDARAVEPLIALLQDENSYVREVAGQALVQLGNARVVELLVAALKVRDERARKAAADVLGKIGAPQAVEPLIAALPDRDAVAALGQIGDARAVEPLIAALKNENWAVRQEAAKTLGKIGDSRAVEPLIAALMNDPVSQTFAEALGAIGDARAVGPLIAALKGDDLGMRQAAVAALVRIGAPAKELLAAALREEDRNVRRDAVEALDNLRWKPRKDETGAYYWITKKEWSRCASLGTIAVEPLMTVLKDENPAVRQGAAQALGKIGASKAVEPLIASLKDENWAVRQEAAKALGKIGDARAVEPLISLLQASDWQARRTGARALLVIFRSGRLDEGHKRLILAQQGTIQARHTDKPGESRRMNIDRSESYALHPSDCMHMDEHTDTPHTDSGIGVDFPV